MADRSLSHGASAPSSGPQPARPVQSETVEIPSHVAALALFTICQLRGRLERLAGQHPNRIDQQLIWNSRDAATALRAALELSRRR